MQEKSFQERKKFCDTWNEVNGDTPLSPRDVIVPVLMELHSVTDKNAAVNEAHVTLLSKFSSIIKKQVEEATAASGVHVKQIDTGNALLEKVARLQIPNEVKIQYNHNLREGRGWFYLNVAFFILSFLLLLGNGLWYIKNDRTYQDYKDFQSTGIDTKQKIWLIEYHNYMVKKNPRDDREYIEKNPYPFK